jgi:DNA-binding response OmpR family regulator
VILIAEDEPKVAALLKNALEKEFYTVELVHNGEEAMKKISVNDYDLIILDVMLPGRDGFQILEETRKMGLNVPVLMLTAKKLSEDKVKGLNIGADDYMIKPFDILELLARVKALTRRAQTIKPNKLQIEDLVVDTLAHEIYRGDKEINLTSKEYRILEYLMRNQGVICSRTMLNEHIWGFNYVKSNIIDVYMTRLRKKIDSHFDKPLIYTVYGVGYKIKA